MQQGPQLDATPVLHSVNQYKAIFALIKVLAEAFLIRVLRRYEILFFFLVVMCNRGLTCSDVRLA